MIIVACVSLLLFVWFGPRCRADGQPDEISAEREGGGRPDRAIGIGTARAHAQEILNSTSLTPSTGGTRVRKRNTVIFFTMHSMNMHTTSVDSSTSRLVPGVQKPALVSAGVRWCPLMSTRVHWCRQIQIIRREPGGSCRKVHYYLRSRERRTGKARLC